MTAAFLPGLDRETQKREKVRKRVRPTSRAQYADGRERFKGRRGHVLRWLAAYYNLKQQWPTSGELARYAADSFGEAEWSWDRTLLYTRRGLSDLQTSGIIETEPDGDRICHESIRKCCVWRVKSR